MSEVEFSLPDVGEAEVELVEWLAKPGDFVAEDDSIIMVRLQGSLAEIGSPVSGQIGALFAEPGQMLASGDRLATIREGGRDSHPPAHDAKAAIGRVFRGTVIVVTEFSALINYHGEHNGLVLGNQITPKTTVDPRVALTVGQAVNVRLVAIDGPGGSGKPRGCRRRRW